MTFARRTILVLAGAAALALGVSLPGAEAGTKRAGGFTSATGMRIDGGTTKISGKTTLKSCQDWCRHNGACGAIQFDAGNKECRFTYGIRGSKPAGNDVTVSVFTEAKEIPKLQSFASTRATHRDAPGHDLAKLDGVPSEHICSTVCTGDSMCEAYVYRASTKTCWLKDGVPMRHNGAGLVSAYVPWEEERRDRPQDVTFRDGKVTGSLWKVEQTGKRQDDAVKACRDMCRGSGSCKAAIIERNTGKCRMFKSINPSSIEQGPQHDDHALFIRFNFKQGVRYVALEQGTQKAADQPGNDLRLQRVDNPALCRSICALDSSCSALTMNRQWQDGKYKNECYLKSRARTPTPWGSNFVETSWLAGDDR